MLAPACPCEDALPEAATVVGVPDAVKEDAAEDEDTAVTAACPLEALLPLWPDEVAAGAFAEACWAATAC